MRASAILVFVICSLAASVATAQATVELETPAKVVRVGDLVPVVITVTAAPGEEPSLPDWSERWGDAEIREVGRAEIEQTADGRVLARQRLLVAFFETGEFELRMPRSEEATEESTSDTGSAAAAAIARVESVLPGGDEVPPPQPPAPPAPLPWGRAFFWTAGILALASVLLLALLLRRLRPVTAASALQSLDPLSALNRALQRLDSIRDSEGVFTEISLHYRAFLGAALEFPAIESTTSEIRHHLRHLDLSPDVLRRTDLMLRRCDGVKFAREEASAADAGSSIEEALTLGAETNRLVSPEGVEESEA